MADHPHLDPYGYPMDTVTWLLDGAKEYSTSKIGLGMEEYNPSPTFPLSCPICEGDAGVGTSPDIQAPCPYHHRVWQSRFRHMTFEQYMEIMKWAGAI